MRCLILAGVLCALSLSTAAARDWGPAGHAQLAQAKPAKGGGTTGGGATGAGIDGATGGGIGGATGGGIGGAAGGIGGAAGGATSGAAGGSQVLAQGPGGTLTVDAVLAYIEALEYSLAQIGQPTQFPQDARMEIARSMAQAYPSVPVATQQELAQARATWTQYAQAWGTLALEQKQEFVYFVLAIYAGEEAAAQALGLNAGGGESGADGDGTYGESYHINPNYEGSDCWASAGCADYTPEGGYVYEDYNPTTESYDYNQ